MLSKSDRDWIEGFFAGYESAITDDKSLHKILLSIKRVLHVIRRILGYSQ